MIRYYVAGVLVALASSVGQVCFKFVSRRTLEHPQSGVTRKALDMLFNPWFIAGVALFVASAGTSVWAMTRMEFSVYYALSALNYFFITLLSRMVLHEPVDHRKIAGNAVIISGILIYSLG